jgi:hypothetical protein
MPVYDTRFCTVDRSTFTDIGAISSDAECQQKCDDTSGCVAYTTTYSNCSLLFETPTCAAKNASNICFISDDNVNWSCFYNVRR